MEDGEGRRRSPPEGEPPSKRRRRPAFDPGLLSSPFYRGPTMYGGAGAFNAVEPRTRPPSFYERRGAEVKVTPAEPVSSVSQTTKRIWELLAHYSSPVRDAKRAPVSGSSTPNASFAPFAPFSSFAPSTSSAPATPSSSSSASASAPRRLRELRLPAMATLLRLKRNNRTVGSAQAAIAASLSSSRPFRPDDYALRTDAEDGAAHKNKLKTKINGRTRDPADEPPPRPVALPDARLDMTGKAMPQIRFDPPPRPSHVAVAPVRRPADAEPPAIQFKFRSPLDATDSRVERLEFIDMTGSKAAPKRNVSVGAEPPTETRNGPGDAFGRTTAAAKANPTAEAKPAGDNSLADFIKKQKAQWECDSCLSRNDNDKNKCVCCEAPKPGSAPAPEKKPEAPPASLPPLMGPSLMGLVQKQKEQWECSCCLARNDANRQKCLCCEAAKPGSEPAQAVKFNFGPASGGSFKFGIDKIDPAKKDTPNVISSGSSEKENKPASGFVFGIPATATSKPETKPTGISFGIPNGNVSTGIGKNDTVAPMPSFGIPKTDIPKPETAPTFSFGIKQTPKETPKIDENSTSSKTPGGFTFMQNKTVSEKEEKPAEQPKSNNLAVNNIATKENNNLPVQDIKPISSIVSGGNEKPIFTFGSPESKNNFSLAESKTTFGSTDTKNVFGSTESKASFESPLPPKVSFGSAEPNKTPFSTGDTSKPSAFGFSSPTTFNFPAVTTSVTKPTFGGSESFSFSSANSKSPATDNVPKFSTMSNLSTTKVGFNSPPSTVPSILTSSLESSAPKDTLVNTPAGIQFQSNMADKKEQPAAQPQIFSFTGSASPASLSNSSTNAFKSNSTTANPVFTFGANPVSKSETTATPFNNQTNIFNPASKLNETPTNNIFKTTPVTSSFPPNNSNIFGSKPSTANAPSTNLFGNSLNESKSAPSIFGTSQINNNPTSQPAQTGSMFSNPPTQQTGFGTGNIFGSNSMTNNTSQAPATNLFGSKTAEPSAGMFGIPKTGNTQPGLFGTPSVPNAQPSGFGAASVPSSGGIFGSHPAVPTPVFGASIPFGEASQTQPAQNAPFKFGATNPTQTSGFGQVPTAGSSAPVFNFGSNAAAPAPSLNSQFNFSMGAPTSAFPQTPGNSAGMAPRRFKKAVRRNVPR